MREFMMSRRSIRAFKEKPVPRDLIEKLIEIGTHAGTALNAQTEGFVVVQDEKRLSQLENAVIEVILAKLKPLGSALGRTLARIKFGEKAVAQSLRYYERFKTKQAGGALKGTIFRNAPVVIAVHGSRSNLSVHENCAIAVRNMEMLAQSMGLGTCWAGHLFVVAGFTNRIAGSLGISDDRNIYSAIMLGYPKHEYRKTIPRKQREVNWL
jgi:nitroreductase